LYRVNLRGEFNVPIGTKANILFDLESLRLASNALIGTKLNVCDFEIAIANAHRNDVIYADPPYTVAHNLNGFLKYNDSIFSWDDQVRLRNSLENAALRGVKIILSNANHQSIRALYKDFATPIELRRKSMIAASREKRGNTTELLFLIG